MESPVFFTLEAAPAADNMGASASWDIYQQNCAGIDLVIVIDNTDAVGYYQYLTSPTGIAGTYKARVFDTGSDRATVSAGVDDTIEMDLGPVRAAYGRLTYTRISGDGKQTITGCKRGF